MGLILIQNRICSSSHGGREDFYLVIDQRSQRQIVKEVCEVLPDVSVPVFPQALVVEAVHLGDLPGLVVPSDQGDPVWVPDLGDYRGSEGHQTKCSPRTAFKSRLCSTLI